MNMNMNGIEYSGDERENIILFKKCLQ